MAKTYIYCIILGILLLLFINSCNNANVDNNYFKGDITEVNDLATSSDEVVLNVLELNGNNYGWPAVHDSLIIFFNPKLGEHFYQVFNIDTGNEIGHYCKRGNGPYEYSALGPIHQLFTENGDLKTLLFAPNESKIMTWNITKSISNKTTVIEKEYDYLWRKENAQICYDQIFRLNEDTILAELRSGLTYNGEISLPKYQKRTLLSNKLVERYTAYKTVIDNDESLIIPEALLFSFDALKPDGTMLAQAMSHLPQLNIINLKNNNIKGIRTEQSDGFRRFEKKDVSIKNYFTRIQADDDKIYVAYLGEDISDSQTYALPKTIYIFNWEGELLNTIKLNEGIREMWFDTIRKILYITNPFTDNILYTKL